MVNLLRFGFGLLILAFVLAPLLIWGLASETKIKSFSEAFKPWIPVYQSLVWPVFILALIAFFTPQFRQLITGIYNAVIKQGREIEIGKIFKLGGGQPTIELATLPISAADLNVADIPIEDFVKKGSRETLERLQQQLRDGRTFNVLVLSDRHRFSRPLLREYVTTLGMRFVVFTTGEWKFEGWIPAGLFAAQMPTPEIEQRQIDEGEFGETEHRLITYDALKQRVSGIRDETVAWNSAAVEALRSMSEANTLALAIVEDGTFRGMIERDAIVARMMLDTYEQSQAKGGT